MLPHLDASAKYVCKLSMRHSSHLNIVVSIGKRVTSFKMKMNKKTDERLQIVQEIVSSIRLIRMYTWDKFFARRVSHSRR
jgi:ATP-binding cassette subfamily C (CFTR/MRP) protein 4